VAEADAAVSAVGEMLTCQFGFMDAPIVRCCAPFHCLAPNKPCSAGQFRKTNFDPILKPNLIQAVMRIYLEPTA